MRVLPVVTMYMPAGKLLVLPIDIPFMLYTLTGEAEETRIQPLPPLILGVEAAIVEGLIPVEVSSET